MALDPEMIAVLDKYFRRMQKVVKEEVQGLREETAQQFQAVREEVRHLGVRIEGLEGEMERAIQRQSEETRHLGVRIEGLESTIQTVAEGVVGNNESLAAFRGEVTREFKEVRVTMQLHYRDLDRRVSLVELEVKEVKKVAAKKVAVKKAARGN